MILFEVLTGDMTRLRYTERYSTCHTSHRETVAEHSYYVCLYAMMIASHIMSESGAEIDMGELLMRATVHDLEEARTGDLFRPFKYSSPEMRDLVNVQASEELWSLLRSTNCDIGLINVHGYWEQAKDRTIEGRIVAFADFLSVVSYFWQEHKMSNRTMEIHHEVVQLYAREFNDPSYDFMRSLVTEAQAMLTKITTEAER